LKQLIQKHQPDQVVYLAAVTTIAESVSSPTETFEIGFYGALNVLMALRECRFKGRMLYVSSSEVYGLLTASELPVSETRLPRPLSPYAVAKIAGEALCYQWNQTEDFEILCARPFNHIGPGQSERFAIANFARQIAAIKLGLAEPVLHIGDIDTTRDFTDVRDVVQAYQLLLDRGRSGETYNVCTGAERSIRSLIEQMCAHTGMTIELRTDPKRLRKSEQRRVCGNNRKLITDTDWIQQFSIAQTLGDILDCWVARLRNTTQLGRGAGA
jgi:GDP-4-dehydro-6-deoxy-D-mannose reductase